MPTLRRPVALQTAKPARITAPPSPDASLKPVPLFEMLARLTETDKGREVLRREMAAVEPRRLIAVFEYLTKAVADAVITIAQRAVAAVKDAQAIGEAAKASVVPAPEAKPVRQTMLDINAVADRLGVSSSTARRMIAEGKLPAGVQIGGRAIRYDSVDLEAAIARLRGV